ncbi:MAG TPA: hypothetical protein VJ608_11500 [Albitalea sp.]|nr:hypothetical protein [Albitalea sp.]
MGTFDTRGGTPRHDPAFDEDDGITAMEEDVLAALEEAQSVREKLDAACEVLTVKLTKALRILLRPGMVLKKHGSDFGVVSVAHGNARGASHFEVVTEPRISKLEIVHPSLTQFVVDAYPLNAEGKRMSGRAGNARGYAGRDTDTVSLSVYLCADMGPDDQRSCNDRVAETIHRAAIAELQAEHAAPV